MQYMQLWEYLIHHSEEKNFDIVNGIVMADNCLSKIDKEVTIVGKYEREKVWRKYLLK